MRTGAVALRTGGVTLQCHAVTAVASASSRSGPPWHTQVGTAVSIVIRILDHRASASASVGYACLARVSRGLLAVDPAGLLEEGAVRHARQTLVHGFSQKCQ